jgi:hypothetical protein
MELLAAYTLGALDELEAAAVRAHLQSCPACQAEFSGLAETASHLAEQSPRLAPPPELRSRVLAAVERDGLPQRSPNQKQAGKLRLRWLWGAAAMVLFLAQAWLLNEFVALRETLVEQQRVLTVLLSSDVEPVDLLAPDPSISAHGSFRMERELDLGLLNYYQLALPGPGSYYQCWFEFDSPSVLPCGQLPLEPDGHGLLLVQIPAETPQTVRVTLESGPVSLPTGTTIMEAELPAEE